MSMESKELIKKSLQNIIIELNNEIVELLVEGLKNIRNDDKKI